MASHMQRPEAAPSDAAPERRTIRATAVVAATMILIGACQGLVGLVAIFEGRMYVIDHNQVYQVDATTWGWIQLILGVVVLIAGLAGWRTRRAERGPGNRTKHWHCEEHPHQQSPKRAGERRAGS